MATPKRRHPPPPLTALIQVRLASRPPTSNVGNQRRASRAALPRRSRPVRCIEELGDPPNEPESGALAQKGVGRTFTRDVLRAFIAQKTHIDVFQEMLPGTE
jgi:hypothetical protein